MTLCKSAVQRPLTGLTTTTEKIRKNPQQVRRMVRAFVRSTRLLKTEKSDLLPLRRRNLASAEKFWKKLIRSWSTRFQTMVSSKTVLQSAIDEAQTVANVTQPVSHTDVVDYSFLREALKK